MMQSGIILAMVESPARFETYPEVNTRAASLPCRSASSPSSSISGRCRAGNIARAASADADARGGVLHGAHDSRMLAHAQIVVRTPDNDFAASVALMQPGSRKCAATSLKIREDPVAALVMECVDCRLKVIVELAHYAGLSLVRT
jgi:hypothetical protein